MESEKAAPPNVTSRPLFSKRSIASVLGLLLLLLGMPLGVYLSIQQTNFLPKAAVSQLPTRPQVSFMLETPKAALVAGQTIKVDVLVRSDLDEANLLVAKLKFPTELISVEKIDSQTESVVSRWVESRYDNQTGEISLVGGILSPGLKTVAGKKYILTSIVFKARAAGVADLEFDTAGSMIFRNSDSSNIIASREGLTINVTGRQVGVEKVASSSATELEDSIKIISPNGGEVYSYNSPIEIKWEGTQENISASLLLNGLILGKIGSNLPNTGVFSWVPEQSLPVVFINSNNTFQIQISGQTKSGVVVSDQSDGPFGIALNPSQNLQSSTISTEEAVDFNKDKKVDFTDLSLLFANYNKPFDSNRAKFDLNKDSAVNDIDLYFLMNFLVKNSLIQA